MFSSFGFYFAISIIVLVFLASAVKILREYQRGVVFTLGRFTSVKGPGIIILIPVVQQMVRTDLRTVALDVPTQDVISRDNVSVRVNAVMYFRVLNPERAIIEVENYLDAISQLAQTTLRSVLGKHELDEMLAERDRLNVDIQEILDAQTDAWGIKVANVEIKHVDLNENMIRAIARQAEAERERRAKVISAEGEQQAAQKLFEAAEILSKNPEAMQLRYLTTLATIAGEKNSTIVFPFPWSWGKYCRGSEASVKPYFTVSRFFERGPRETSGASCLPSPFPEPFLGGAFAGVISKLTLSSSISTLTWPPAISSPNRR